LKYIRPTDRILVAGCGNSELSANLYDIGYHNIVSVDISSTVIRQMLAKHADARPDMKFLQMDLLEVCLVTDNNIIIIIITINCYYKVQMFIMYLVHSVSSHDWIGGAGSY